MAPATMRSRSRTPGWLEKAGEDTREESEDIDEPSEGLLSQKAHDSAWSYNERTTLRMPAWAQKYTSKLKIPAGSQEHSNNGKVRDGLRHMLAFAARLSRRTILLFALVWLVLIILWARSGRSSEATIVPFQASWLNPTRAGIKIPSDGAGRGTWKKPRGFQIVGIVFYGRRVHVDMLDCYLQQNLAKNGGYLDGVIFFQNTADEDDIAFLEKLVAAEPRYKILESGDDIRDWAHMWDRIWDENTMYFKIDDDLVYIHPDAIPLMVHTLLEYPEAHNVQANIVNSPSTSWQHFHANAVRPYLPEIVEPRPWVVNESAWRPSELPAYPASFAKDKYDFDDKPPFNGHRWLPLEESSVALMKTPIRQCENYAWGTDWKQWAIAAQSHYSLFNNIEEGTMDRYIFGNGDGIFNTQYERYKINLMAIWGSTINLARPGSDDERELTEEIPRKLGMPVLVQTKALGAHFSFGPQRLLYQTDLMLRYRAYANERVCAPNNQKEEFPDWQETLENFSGNKPN